MTLGGGLLVLLLGFAGGFAENVVHDLGEQRGYEQFVVSTFEMECPSHLPTDVCNGFVKENWLKKRQDLRAWGII